MFSKFTLLMSTMTALSSVIVDGAVLPVWRGQAAGLTRSTKTDPKPIVLTPFNPKKNKQSKIATAKVASASDSAPASAPPMLQGSETLYWFSDGYYASATLTSIDKNQKIVSFETWEDMITSLECPSDSDITITFNEDVSIDEIHSQLGWVSELKENNFIFVTDQECGGEDGRQPYIINGLEVGKSNGKITLKGQPAEWDTLGVDTQLHIATEPFGVFLEAQEDSLVKRGSGFLDLSNDFSGFSLASHVQDGVTLALTCAECKLTGGINWDLTFNKNPFSDDFGPEGQLSTANGFGGRFALGVKASGALLDGLSLADIELLAIPLSPISLGKIAKLTPQITVNALASISAVQAEVEAKFGIGMTIPDGTTLRIGGESDEIDPQFEMIGPEIRGKVSVSALLTPLVTLDISAEVLSKGVTVGFGLEAPALDAKLAVEANTQGVCGNPNGFVGLSGTVGVGANLNFFYGIGQPKDQPNKISLLSRRHELWGECLVLEERPAEAPVTSIEPPIETPIETPFPTPFPTPIETPIDNPVETPIPTPIETPIEPPFETPIVNPVETPVPTPSGIYTPIEGTPITPTYPSATPDIPVPECPGNFTYGRKRRAVQY